MEISVEMRNKCICRVDQHSSSVICFHLVIVQCFCS